MAHFCELDRDNLILQTIVVDNAVVNNLPYPDSEPLGIQFCQSLYGQSTIWLQTSINGSFRRCYGQPGYSYMPQYDIFIEPKPYPSWVFDPVTKNWVPPTPMPSDGQVYYWDENYHEWVLVGSSVVPDYEVT